ncbi:MAG: hypothetical protein PHQ52_07240, partial [Candidatus Omnitrophica bacterium]|nr:hypothetical protein [Candidatus Omnitrophota bacterium]
NIQLVSKKGIEKLQADPDSLDNRTYPIALKEEITSNGVSIPNYNAAGIIGLSLASLRVVKEKSPQEYDKVMANTLKQFISVYERYGIDISGFNEDVLNIMVVGPSRARIPLIIKYALPPVIKVVEQIELYHKKMQLLLQSA